MSQIPMTAEGAENLRLELERLKKEKPLVSQAIATARDHGDLKENAEYHAAREQMGFLEGRIQDIEGKLSRVRIIDVTTIPYTGKVVFGATVTLLNCATEKQVTYKIVGDDEADVNVGKISVNSPIGRGLLGKEEGDVVSITTPGGVVELEIESVKHI